MSLKTIGNPAHGGKRLTVVLLCLALGMQSLAPPGYMAGSGPGGWIVVLCPEGLPRNFPAGSHHHGAHDAAAEEGPAMGAHCPLGGMLDTALVSLPVLAAGPSPLPGAELPAIYADAILAPFRLAHPPRAPPLPV